MPWLDGDAFDFVAVFFFERCVGSPGSVHGCGQDCALVLRAADVALFEGVDHFFNVLGFAFSSDEQCIGGVYDD